MGKIKDDITVEFESNDVPITLKNLGGYGSMKDIMQHLMEDSYILLENGKTEVIYKCQNIRSIIKKNDKNS